MGNVTTQPIEQDHVVVTIVVPNIHLPTDNILVQTKEKGKEFPPVVTRTSAPKKRQSLPAQTFSNIKKKDVVARGSLPSSKVQDMFKSYQPKSNPKSATPIPIPQPDGINSLPKVDSGSGPGPVDSSKSYIQIGESCKDILSDMEKRFETIITNQYSTELCTFIQQISIIDIETGKKIVAQFGSSIVPEEQYLCETIAKYYSISDDFKNGNIDIRNCVKDVQSLECEFLHYIHILCHNCNVQLNKI